MSEIFVSQTNETTTFSKEKQGGLDTILKIDGIYSNDEKKIFKNIIDQKLNIIDNTQGALNAFLSNDFYEGKIDNTKFDNIISSYCEKHKVSTGVIYDFLEPSQNKWDLLETTRKSLGLTQKGGYDKDLFKAIIDFQRKHNLKIDGQINRDFLAKAFFDYAYLNLQKANTNMSKTISKLSGVLSNGSSLEQTINGNNIECSLKNNKITISINGKKNEIAIKSLCPSKNFVLKEISFNGGGDVSISCTLSGFGFFIDGKQTKTIPIKEIIDTLIATNSGASITYGDTIKISRV